MQKPVGNVRFALSNLCGQFLHFDIFLVVYDLHLLCRDCEVLHQLPITFLCLYLVYFLLLQLTFLRLFRLHLSWNAETLRFATGSVFCLFVVVAIDNHCGTQGRAEVYNFYFFLVFW